MPSRKRQRNPGDSKGDPNVQSRSKANRTSPGNSQSSGLSGGHMTSQEKPDPLRSFLQQSLPFLVKNELHTPSVGTRQFGFFDMHLHKDLRLKEIVFLDDFVDALCQSCDPYIADLTEDEIEAMPQISLPDADNIVDEDSLRKYALRISEMLSPVASMLLFKSGWNSVFEFSATPGHNLSPSLAAADAYLHVADEFESFAYISPAHKTEINLVKGFDLQNCLVAEYKNLGTQRGIFDNLRALEGDFKWTACQERSRPDDPSTWCKNRTHRVGGARPSICGRRTGPDATKIEDFIKECSSSSDRPKKRHRRDNEDKLGQDDLKPRLVLQQLWASAVARDTTFIILSAGNKEYLGIRHRGRQTLYLSPPIQPTDSGYMKIYVALYIASYKDALDRARLLKSGPLSPNVLSLLQLYLDKEPKLPNFSKSIKVPRAQLDLSQSDADIETALEHELQLPLRMHLHRFATTQYNSNTWTLSRISQREREDKSIRHLELPSSLSSTKMRGSPSIFIDLDQPIQGRVFRVCPAIIYSSDDIRHLSYSLVIKMARQESEKAELNAEYENDQILRSRGVECLPKCYGLFSYRVNEVETRCFLLRREFGLTIAGRGSKLDAHIEKFHEIYEDSLFSFHFEGHLAHNDITSDHVLMDIKQNKVAFISLSHCMPLTKDNSNTLIKADRIALQTAMGRGHLFDSSSDEELTLTSAIESPPPAPQGNQSNLRSVLAT